jgi:hypothetical protein
MGLNAGLYVRFGPTTMTLIRGRSQPITVPRFDSPKEYNQAVLTDYDTPVNYERTTYPDTKAYENVVSGIPLSATGWIVKTKKEGRYIYRFLAPDGKVPEQQLNGDDELSKCHNKIIVALQNIEAHWLNQQQAKQEKRRRDEEKGEAHHGAKASDFNYEDDKFEDADDLLEFDPWYDEALPDGYPDKTQLEDLNLDGKLDPKDRATKKSLIFITRETLKDMDEVQAEEKTVVEHMKGELREVKKDKASAQGLDATMKVEQRINRLQEEIENTELKLKRRESFMAAVRSGERPSTQSEFSIFFVYAPRTESYFDFSFMKRKAGKKGEAKAGTKFRVPMTKDVVKSKSTISESDALVFGATIKHLSGALKAHNFTEADVRALIPKILSGWAHRIQTVQSTQNPLRAVKEIFSGRVVPVLDTHVPNDVFEDLIGKIKVHYRVTASDIDQQIMRGFYNSMTMYIVQHEIECMEEATSDGKVIYDLTAVTDANTGYSFTEVNETSKEVVWESLFSIGAGSTKEREKYYRYKKYEERKGKITAIVSEPENAKTLQSRWGIEDGEIRKGAPMYKYIDSMYKAGKPAWDQDKAEFEAKTGLVKEESMASAIVALKEIISENIKDAGVIIEQIISKTTDEAPLMQKAKRAARVSFVSQMLTQAKSITALAKNQNVSVEKFLSFKNVASKDMEFLVSALENQNKAYFGFKVPADKRSAFRIHFMRPLSNGTAVPGYPEALELDTSRENCEEMQKMDDSNV